jgi:hypothetical protein
LFEVASLWIETYRDDWSSGDMDLASLGDESLDRTFELLLTKESKLETSIKTKQTLKAKVFLWEVSKSSTSTLTVNPKKQRRRKTPEETTAERIKQRKLLLLLAKGLRDENEAATGANKSAAAKARMKKAKAREKRKRDLEGKKK